MDGKGIAHRSVGRGENGYDGGRAVTWAERMQDRDLHLQFLPWNPSGMNSLDIRLDVVFENFVTSPVYLSLYKPKPDLFV